MAALVYSTFIWCFYAVADSCGSGFGPTLTMLLLSAFIKLTWRKPSWASFIAPKSSVLHLVASISSVYYDETKLDWFGDCIQTNKKETLNYPSQISTNCIHIFGLSDSYRFWPVDGGTYLENKCIHLYNILGAFCFYFYFLQNWGFNTE